MKKERQRTRLRFIIINLIRALLVIAFFGAIFNGRKLILLISVLAFTITFLPLIFRKLFDIELPAQFEVVIILFIYGTLLFGEVHGFYEELWWYGLLINFASAAALGFVGLVVMCALYRGDKIVGSPLVIAFFSFCFAVAIGTIWQFFEYFLDNIFGFQLYGVGNIMHDLIANIIGAFAVSTAGYFYVKNGKIVIISRLVEKIMEKNPRIFGKKDPANGIIEMIEKGENSGLEFKSTLRTNLYTNQIDKKMEQAVLKTITAYLNSGGGTLLVGVSDKGEILGVNKDNFESNDKLSLHFTNLIKNHIGTEYLPFIGFEIVNVDGVHILKIDCKKSDKYVFLKCDKEEEFYVRNGPSNARLSGNSLIDYINHNFNKIG